ncbi:MAG: HEAT repeat domain-containing protein, partial [Chloroflexota bacterium]
MSKHLEPPLFQQEFYFGWVNGSRVIVSRSVSDYSERLIELLGSPKSRLRWIAADQLGQLYCQEAVEALIAALKDAHWLVRLHAAKALGRIGDQRALLSLLEVIDDNNAFVRRRVVTA